MDPIEGRVAQILAESRARIAAGTAAVAINSTEIADRAMAMLEKIATLRATATVRAKTADFQNWLKTRAAEKAAEAASRIGNTGGSE
jgi:chaperonin GroEL (HSP60 family)